MTEPAGDWRSGGSGTGIRLRLCHSVDKLFCARVCRYCRIGENHLIEGSWIDELPALPGKKLLSRCGPDFTVSLGKLPFQQSRPAQVLPD